MSDFNNEKQAMQSLTKKYVDKLACIWEQIFHPDTCRENLCKLIDHATYFYDGLVVESLSRKTFIENEINDLKKEADDLKRLLHTDIQLPRYETNEVPLIIVQSELDKSLEDLREQLRLRKEQICELLLEQETLCEELGEAARALPADPLPTAQEIGNFRKHLDALREERVQRMTKLSTLRREIKNFLQILELNVNAEHVDRLLNQRQIKLNKQTFEDLERMHSLYSSQVLELRETIHGMRKKLDTLWDRLKTSPNTRNKFKRYNDYNQHTCDVFRDEIQRCESLKKQNIKVFVQQIREEITKMWNKTLKSDTQKSRFSNFTSTCYTDDLLVLHEMELEDLNLFYESNKQIFELFADRNILWDRMNALEAKASEPGRYNNRGGHLLKEEKERKTIAKKLPKIEQKIFEFAKKYEEREHSPFLVYGENIIDFIAAQWDKKRQQKELLQSARKNGKPTPSSTSKINNTIRTPLSLKSASSVSSLRKTPSVISLVPKTASTQKRKLEPSDRHNPIAKRSLMQALNSPTVFLKPSTSKSIQHAAKSSAKKTNKLIKSGSSPKQPLVRNSKLIATTIRRRSGRHSGSMKKRLSANKKSASSKAIPKIVVENCQSDGYTTDDTYDSFQKSIEPTSRSSVIQNITGSTKSLQQIYDENFKLTKLPRPRATNRTPSKQYTNISNCSRTPTHNNHISPSTSATIGRKLTTKNLPIIM